jgi:hypothetical protein
MASLLEDPRIRQTWNSISQNAESATETAAAGIWTFTHTYINPCLSGISSIINQCTGLCFPDREERERARRLRERGRTRGRAEYSFDFYDDWDEDIDGGSSGGLLGWGNDELDRLLAGSGSHSHGTDEQPTGRRRGMSYGTRKGGARRKSTIDGLPDPTIIPSTNPLGFLQRLPWKIGGTLRYKPSAADLQEHPGANRVERLGEGEPLLDSDQENPEQEDNFDPTRTRNRSSTTGSGDTSDSFRSRGDLFPSDGEDDAVPLSDEFAMVLERRITQGSGTDDRGSSKTRSSKGKRAAGSRAMSRTVSRTTQSSGNSRPSAEGTRVSSTTELHANSGGAADKVETPSLTRLEQEEEQLRQEEDAEIERKRYAAAHLAAQRGLSINEDPPYDVTREVPVEIKQEDPIVKDIHAPSSTEIVDIRENAPTTVTSPENATLEVAKGLDKVFVPAKLPNFS